MTTDWERIGRLTGDPVSNVLKWILLAVAVVTFAMLGWMTGLTYKEAPPLPGRFAGADGTLLMSAADIQAGKAGFKKPTSWITEASTAWGPISARTTPPPIWFALRS